MVIFRAAAAAATSAGGSSYVWPNHCLYLSGSAYSECRAKTNFPLAVPSHEAGRAETEARRQAAKFCETSLHGCCRGRVLRFRSPLEHDEPCGKACEDDDAEGHETKTNGLSVLDNPRRPQGFGHDGTLGRIAFSRRRAHESSFLLMKDLSQSWIRGRSRDARLTERAVAPRTSSTDGRNACRRAAVRERRASVTGRVGCIASCREADLAVPVSTTHCLAIEFLTLRRRSTTVNGFWRRSISSYWNPWCRIASSA